MEKPIVSIIIPMYNCEMYIEKCLNSVIEQTYKNIEIILVDDGSIDKSLEICKLSAERDKRVKIFQKKNKGASSARNYGLDHVTGKYIMFVDGDDYIEKNMVESLVSLAERNKDDIVISCLIVDKYDKCNNLISTIKKVQKKRVLEGNRIIAEGIIDLVENESISGPCAKLIRSDIILDNNIRMPENISLQEDLHFILQVLEKTQKIDVIDKCYYHYRKGVNESVTSRYYSNKYQMTDEVHDKLIEYYRKRTDNISIMRRIYYIHIKNTYAALINLFHRNCKYTKKEKIAIINEIINSNKTISMLGKAQKSGLKYKILLKILQVKNAHIIYYISKVIYIMKSKFKIKY